MEKKKNIEYYERALRAQKEKINDQKKELSRMNNIYLREVRRTEAKDAFKFLCKVIWGGITNKIKK